MTEDKEITINFFQSKQIEARHFPKEKEGKKADFELYFKNNLFGYCELKSIVEYDFVGERQDSTYNKIQSKVHNSAKQLESVNSIHSVPNIVFFINHTKKVGCQDLWYVLTGQATPPSQPSVPIDLRYFSRLKEKGDFDIIDYFIWKNVFDNIIYFTINSSSKFATELKDTISSKAYEIVNNNGNR